MQNEGLVQVIATLADRHVEILSDRPGSPAREWLLQFGKNHHSPTESFTFLPLEALQNVSDSERSLGAHQFDELNEQSFMNPHEALFKPEKGYEFQGESILLRIANDFWSHLLPCFFKDQGLLVRMQWNRMTITVQHPVEVCALAYTYLNVLIAAGQTEKVQIRDEVLRVNLLACRVLRIALEGDGYNIQPYG